jgi:RNA polymerase sigma-70 factor, ECF subfamily
MIAEHELLQQAKTGDQEAFAALHAALEPPVYRYVRRLIGDGQECEDVLQETFLSLYQNMERIVPLENVRPYVFRIARNRCYDVLRRHKDALSLDDELTEHKVSFDLKGSHESPPDEVAHWLLLKLEVDAAIDQLPQVQRETLLLYCEEGMSYAEIAEITGVNIGTVKSRLFHAKKNLRGLVRPEVLIAIQETDHGTN